MKISYRKLLDISFSLAVFSMIIMGTSVIGKGFQILFIILSLLGIFYKIFYFTGYQFIEFLFVIYVLLQVLCGIAELPSTTLQMFSTVLYVTLFTWSTFNYVVYRKDIYTVAKLYAQASAIAFVVTIVLYFNTLLNFRLSASSDITIGGFVLFGGSSSTALALQAMLPMFFIILFPPKGERKKAYPYIIFFSLVAIFTGTRKTLVLIVYSVFFVNELMKEKKSNFKILKILILIAVLGSAAYLMLINIPTLYSFIGYRIEAAVSYYLLSGEGDSSITVRNRMVESAINLFNERRLFGWGMDYFKGSKQSSLGYYAHNNYLEMLSGGGVVGFVIYYLRYIYLLIVLIKSSFKSSKYRNVWISCTGFVITMLVLEYWQVTYLYRYIMIYPAMIIGIIYLAKQERKAVKN